MHGFGQRYLILGFFPKFSEFQCFFRGDSINLVELLFIFAVSTVHVYNSDAYYSIYIAHITLSTTSTRSHKNKNDIV